MQPHIGRAALSATLLAGGSASGSTARSAAALGRFDHYNNFNRQLRFVQPHQALALLRGDKENALKLSVEIDVTHMSNRMLEWFLRDCRGRWQDSGLRDCELARDIVTQGQSTFETLRS
jgi:transcriptional accessory protein Tex/SPT6